MTEVSNRSEFCDLCGQYHLVVDEFDTEVGDGVAARTVHVASLACGHSIVAPAPHALWGWAP